MSIDIEKGTKEKLGHCLACANRDYRVVYEVILNSLSFRICEECKKELIDKLSRR